MKQRIITAILILVVVLPPLWLGGIALDLLILAFAAVAVYEGIKVCFNKVSMPLYVASLVLALAIAYLPQVFFYLVLVLMFLLYFSIAVFNEKYTVENCAYLLVIMLIVSLTIIALKSVYIYSNLVMMYILLATYLTDTGAYFAGRFFGKHKLNERISPKKTIEGSIGGYLFGAIVSFVFGYFYLSETLPISFIALYSLSAPIAGQIGDLAFSAIKRHYGVKDFGNIFPGHGGVLDRIDSLIFNLLVFLACLSAIQGIVGVI